MNVTVIAALVAAVSAIIAPVVTAIVNNRYQLKMRKLEIYELKRIEAINEYADSINSYLNNVCGRSEINFAKYKHTIFLYAPRSAWSMIEKINSSIDKNQLAEARVLLPKLMEKLSPSVLGSKHYCK